jgi:hypothetical protein
MITFEAVVYLLCLGASVLVAALLVRSWARSREPLLLWSALCFVLLAVNNLAVVVDIYLLKQIDLTLLRQACSLAAICVLLYGFVWRAE